MKITALVENTSQIGFPVEHGLSLFIETGSLKILFDTGQSELFAENAQRTGISLEDADLAVISHGHYDHGGGLAKFLQINKKAPVYISGYAFEPHYGVEGNYIGLDPSIKDDPRLVFTDGVREIRPGLTLYSCNDRQRSFLTPSGLSCEENGERIDDDFRHEQYLLIEENGKRVLISGCSHKGIQNIVEWFRPDVLVGGFHLFRLLLDDKLRSCAEYLDSFDTVYYTCHCTGTEQYQYMLPFMKNLHYISAGETILVE